MKTKIQKQNDIEKGKKYFAMSEVVVVADFTGLTANELNTLRKMVKEAGGIFFVMKKRLLRFILKDNGIDFDTKKLLGQTGVLFSKQDSLATAKLIYNFAKPFKAKQLFKILGGWEVKTKSFLDPQEIEMLGTLPSWEELLGKFVFLLKSPLQKLAFILNEQAKKSS